MSIEVGWEKLIEYVQKYIIALYRTITGPDVNLFKPRGRGKNRTINRYLVPFIFISIGAGLLIQILIPKHPPITERLASIILILMIWIFISFVFHWLFNALGGTKDFRWSVTVCLQILSASYLTTGLITFLLTTFWVYFQNTTGNTAKFNPSIIFFIVEFLFLIWLLPRGLNKVHFPKSTNKLYSFFRVIISVGMIFIFTSISYMVFSVTGLTISPNLLVATPSPLSANLLVSSPELIFTSDVVAYQPTDFRVTITNTSNIPIENQFQVDIFIDPENVTQDSIAIEESDGSVIVDSIGAGQSRIITITAPLGFDNSFDANTPVYSMVDSLQTINETDENNNISLSTTISERPPAPTPEPTSTNTPSNIGISGTVNYPTKQETTFRTEILVLNENNQPTAFTFADRTTGDYSFFNLPEGTYTIKACGTTDIDSEKYYYGLIEGIIIPPDSVANIPTIKTDSCEDPWFLDN